MMGVFHQSLMKLFHPGLVVLLIGDAKPLLEKIHAFHICFLRIADELFDTVGERFEDSFLPEFGQKHLDYPIHQRMMIVGKGRESKCYRS